MDFTEFVTQRSHHLYRSAYLLTTSPHAAEDLVQSALAKVYVAWPRVRSADDPVAYVQGVLVKTFLSQRRLRRNSEIPTSSAPDVAAARHDPLDRLVLMAALRTLAPLDRAVVVLRFWEDRSVAQTAHALDLSEAAVKNRTLRALRALRAHLADLELDHGSAR